MLKVSGENGAPSLQKESQKEKTMYLHVLYIAGWGYSQQGNVLQEYWMTQVNELQAPLPHLGDRRCTPNNCKIPLEFLFSHLCVYFTPFFRPSFYYIKFFPIYMYFLLITLFRARAIGSSQVAMYVGSSADCFSEKQDTLPQIFKSVT